MGKKYTKVYYTRAAVIAEMGENFFVELLDMPTPHDRVLVALWLVTALSLDHPLGYEWCRNTVTVAMEEAPQAEIKRHIERLKDARSGK